MSEDLLDTAAADVEPIPSPDAAAGYKRVRSPCFPPDDPALTLILSAKKKFCSIFLSKDSPKDQLRRELPLSALYRRARGAATSTAHRNRCWLRAGAPQLEIAIERARV